VNSNGCATGFFDGGIADVFPGLLLSDGIVYARVRMWQWAETYEAARAAGWACGQTPIVAVQTVADRPAYLAGLQDPPYVGPLTPWFMIERFTRMHWETPTAGRL